MLYLTRLFTSPGPRVAISCFFLISGLVIGTWIGRIPAVTSNLDLDKAEIGSLLVFAGVGSMIAFQFIGRLIERYGSPRSAQFAGYLTVVALAFVALAPTPASLGGAFLFFGFVFGAVGVAMNAQGVTIERQIGRPIMSSLHGFFSLGTLIGSAFGGLMAQIGIGAVSHFLGIGVVGLVTLVWAGVHFVEDEPAQGASKVRSGLSIPPRALWSIGIIAFCAGFSEGSMYDWSALYIHDELGASESAGALAFTVFSATMLIGRFSGDKVVEWLGTGAVVFAGSLIAGLGLVAALVMDTVLAAFAGFAILGLGLSVLMPLVYSAAGSHPGISSVRGVAAIATMGFAGLMVGPPILGTVADATSLRAALDIVVLLCAIMAVFARTLKSTSIHVDVGSVPGMVSERAA